MDFIFLPEKVKKLLEAKIPGTTPISILRSSGSLEGEPGEGYVVAYKDKALLFSRAMGADNYKEFEASYTDSLANISVRKDKFNSFLDLNIGGKPLSVKFSSFEEKDLDPMLERCASVGANANAKEAPVQSVEDKSPEPSREPSISPIVGMAAGMMYLAASDNEIVKEEDNYIRKACFNDEKIIREGSAYYSSHTYEELLAELELLDHQQSLCVLANFIEVSMSDGILHKIQQEMVWQFTKAACLSKEEYQNFRDVLLVKNQITALYN